MENYRRLFKEAERIKPGESMWRNIAAAVSGRPRSDRTPGAAASQRANPDASAPKRVVPGAVAVQGPEARPWRLAASLAVGLGALAALAVLFREPLPTASGEASRGVLEDSAGRQLATAEAADGSFPEGLQEWHADLGVPAGERFEEASAESWADDTMLLNALLED